MQDLTKEEWKMALAEDENAVLIDCRTPREWNEGVQKGALLIDIMEGPAFMDKINQMDKSKNFYVYCRSGNRSGQACMLMDANGFSQAYNLLGGMLEWDGETVMP